MPPVKLGKVYFKPSEVYVNGLWMVTAKCGENQYDMAEQGSMTKRDATKYFKQRAHDYFVCFYNK